jgi:hypothetical protein
MRTDAQVAALLLAVTLPIRRYGWCIDPNGARDEVGEGLANDLNLPIEGRSQGRPDTGAIASVTTATCSTRC